MKQRINFYRPAVATTGPLTIQRMLHGLGITLLLLALYSGIRGWQLGHIERSLADLESRREEMVTTLEQSKRSGVAPQVAALKEQAAALAADREQRGQILERLRQGGFGNLTGFSPYLQGFARRRNEGLWLTSIQLSAGGSQMLLDGAALSEALVPEFIQRLGAESTLAGLTFKHVVLRRGNDAAAPILFELGTEPRDAARGARS